jgi:three-Cys-motif partner protein
MSTKPDPRWVCDRGTRAKLEILRSYLGAWFNILASSGVREAIYFDGFCGPGQYVGGEDGSPVLAARIASSVAQRYPDFRAYLACVDHDLAALQHLATLPEIKKPHPDAHVDIRHGKFEGTLTELLQDPRYPIGAPIFSFVDPFGFGGLSFASMRQLMRNQSSEIFVNLMCGFMNRFKEHPDPDVRQKIERMIGADNLQRVLNAQDGIDELCAIYRENLLSLGPYVLRFMMRDETNVRDNALFFCGRNERGFEKIEAMWKVDKVNGANFSEYVAQRDETRLQLPGFDAPQTGPLRKQLLTEFQGKSDITVEVLKKWTIAKTETFLPKHLRIELEALLADRRISVRDPNQSPRKRRSGDWPDRLIISFSG